MRLFSRFVIQIGGQKREPLLEHALAHSYGVEVADFALPRVVNNEAEKKRLRGWYVEHLKPVAGPISLHAPFVDILPASGDKLVQEAARKRLAESLDIAEEIGAKVAIVHTGFHPMVKEEGYLEDWTKRHAEFWAAELKARKTRILFENMWEPEPAVIAALLKATARLKIKFCLDVGHANLHSGASPADWVEALRKHLVYLHLHDNHGRRDNHLPPGEGTVDWAALAKALAKLRKKPLAVPEVVGLEALEKSEAFLARL